MEHKVIGINDEKRTKLFDSRVTAFSHEQSVREHSVTVMVCACGYKSEVSDYMVEHIERGNNERK